MDPNARPPRKVGIADHIWDAFDEMASSMGSDRDALINQAMFMFARLNGFLELNGTAKPMNGAGGKPAAAAARPAAPMGMGPGAGGRAARMPEEKPAGRMDDDPQRREVAERVLETAAELERLIKGKNQQPEAPAEEAEPEAAEDMGMDVAEEQAAEGGDEGGLYLMSEGGDMDKIAKERFVIGRGKHCDFVINSGKVSREHAVVMRDGSDWFIEDLGSSNGTWYNKQRIKRRKIEDGDEYYICSERVKFVMR
jgi:hypothetical protein